MKNEYIQIGIDLGTTNSEIAVNRSGEIEIAKNDYNDEYTPSVFGIDKGKNKIVGKRAYEKLYVNTSPADSKNFIAEIKRTMGTPETVHFKRINSKMTPEEISAEILKALISDATKKYPEVYTNAAVITIPAAFSTLQAEATKRAGNLAGIEHVVLLQEPIAAAISHGFGTDKDQNCLVYDLGGGTFDIALVSSSDGILSILSHNGDNFLGGKNFDAEIIDKVIAPKINEKFLLNEFNLSNDMHREKFAILKYVAEKSKIQLSHSTTDIIEIDNLGLDDDGRKIELDLNFTREEFEGLIKPYIDTTIELSVQTMEEVGFTSESIDSIILVGGATRIPYVRERLFQTLNIQIDSSADPLTSVARGACIYGISQKLPDNVIYQNQESSSSGSISFSLNYETLTSDTEEIVSGVFEGLKSSAIEHYVQIQSESGYYVGKKIKLKDGVFLDNIVLEKGKSNLFWIYLFDQNGNSLPIVPDSFTITHGLSVSGSPLPHSIGIAALKKGIASAPGEYTEEEFVRYFAKGDILPVKHTEVFRTARKLLKEDTDNPLWINVGEGESSIPDRNTYICTLGINGDDLPHDLPESTEVEITIEISESREVLITAYVPLIDIKLNARSTVRDEDISIQDLDRKLEAVQARLTEVISHCSPDEVENVNTKIKSLSSALVAANTDEDSKRRAQKELKELKIMLDNIEEATSLEQLIENFESETNNINSLLDISNTEEEREKFASQLQEIRKEGNIAIANDDEKLLKRINEQLYELASHILLSNPAVWVIEFENIIASKSTFSNEKEANRMISEAKDAIDRGNFEELKHCVRSLLALLPSDEQKQIRQNISGLVR